MEKNNIEISGESNAGDGFIDMNLRIKAKYHNQFILMLNDINDGIEDHVDFLEKMKDRKNEF